MDKVNPVTVNACWKNLWSEAINGFKGSPGIDEEINKIIHTARDARGEGFVHMIDEGMEEHIEQHQKVLFADDTNIVIMGNNIAALQENLNSTINAVQTWFSANNLIVNIDKTTTMFFHNHQKKSPVVPHVLFNARTIPVSVVTKFLGLHISENLKWNYHCDSLKSKLNTGYYLISQLQKITNPHVCRTMYYACFHSHLKYGITLWG